MAQYVGRYAGFVNSELQQWLSEKLTGYNVSISSDGLTITITDDSGTGLVIVSNSNGFVTKMGVTCGGTDNTFSITANSKPHFVVFSCDSGFIIRFGTIGNNVRFDMCINSKENSFAVTNYYNATSNNLNCNLIVAKNGNVTSITLISDVINSLYTDSDKEFVLHQLYTGDGAVSMYFVKGGFGDNTVTQSNAGNMFVSGLFALPDNPSA